MNETFRNLRKMKKKNRGFGNIEIASKVKGKVFYYQEPPSGESTTTECGFNYQLLAVMY